MKTILLLSSLNIALTVTPVTQVNEAIVQRGIVTPSFDFALSQPLIQNVGTNATGDSLSDKTNITTDSIDGYDFSDFANNDKFNRAIVTGAFDFHTYSNEKVVKSLVLWKDYASSTINQIVYRCEYLHHASTRWATQTSIIGIVINIKPAHIGLVNSVNLEVVARAYAETSGLVHSGHTNITIDRLNFGYDNQNSNQNHHALIGTNF